MARIGTAYIEVGGDFSALRRQLAALGREQGTLKIKTELDKPSAVRAKKQKGELAETEEFDVVGIVDRSSIARAKAQKKDVATDEEFHIHGAFDLASLARVKAQKESIGGEEEVKLRFDVDVASLGKAIGAQIALKGATTAVVKESGALSDIMNRSSLSIGQMVGAALLGAPIILDLAAAMTALGASAAAAAAGIGALAIGGAGVGAVGLGGILAIAGPAIGSLQDLMTAQEAANKSQATGAKSAGLATMQSAAQIKAARQQVADATRGVTTAEGQLELAQESAKLAQEALTQAREDATRQLQDMRRAAIEGETAEERARLSLQQANENLNQLLMSGTATALDLADADLSIVEARQNLRDVTIDGNRAQQDFNEAQRGGIDQMSQVVSAQQSLDSAVRGVESAQQGVADAHRQVARALENLELQQRQANQATVAGGASMAALARAQRKAGPEAVRFAETLKTLGRRWRNLTAEGKTDFFRILNNGVDRLNRKLPLLADSANRSMRALRRGFDGFLDRATGPEFNHFIHVMTRTFAKSIGPISRAFGNIAKVLQRIAVAVAPDIVRMSKGFEDMTKGWLDSTKNAKGLRETVHGLVKQAETWLGLVKAVGNVLGSLFTSGMDEGKSAIKGITDQLNEWADWIDKHPKKMHDFFANGLETAKELATTIGGFFETFVDLADALRPIVRGFLDFIQGLNSIKVGNISALTALIGLFIAYKTVQGIANVVDNFRDLTDRLRDMRTAMGGGRLASAFERLRGWFSGVTGAASRVASAVADWTANVASSINTKAGKIREAIRNAMRAGRTFITTAATSAAVWAGGLVSNIRSSRLSRRLGIIFKAIALRLGKIMAASVAAAVVVGEGIGGAAAGLSGLLRAKLPDKMTRVGKVAGRAFGAGMLIGILAAIPFIVTAITNKIRDELDLKADTSKGGGLFGGSPFGISLGPLDDLSGWLQRHGGRSPAGQHGGLVTEQGIVSRGFIPEGFQQGGMVGGRRRRPGIRDTVPALLEVGELVIPKKMVDETRKSAKKTALVLTDELGEGYEKVADDSKDFVKRHGTSMETLRKTAAKHTEKFRKGTVDDFDKTGDSAIDRTKRMRANVVEGFARMRSSSVEQSGKMRSGVGEDFRSMTGAVGDGLRRIAQMTNNALQALKVKKVNFRISEGGGRGQERQTGGMIVPGTGVGDSVHAKLPVGSGVVNRKAADVMLEPREIVFPPDEVRKMGGPKAIEAINKVFPRFQEGGVVDRTGVRHYQAGGYVGMQPEITRLAQTMIRRFGGSLASGLRPGDDGHHGQGLAADIFPDDWAGASRFANSIGSSLLEGIYNPGMFGGSAVSWQSGQHVPASFWGGATWGQHLDHIHLATTSAIKGAMGLVNKLKKLTVEGPDGPLKDIPQAILDKVRTGADRYIASKQPAMSTDFMGVEGTGTALMRRISRQRGWSFADWWALDAAETSHGANLVNPFSTARLRGQFLDINWGAYGPGSDPAQNPSMREQIISMAQYIAERYGNPTAAWAFHQANNYYKRGGIVAPYVGSFAQGGEVKRDGLAMVHKGEKVLPKPSEGLTMHQVLRGLKRALNDGGKALRQFLDKFHRRLERMDKSRLREFLRKLNDWSGPAAKKMAAVVREELHDRPGRQQQRPRSDEGRGGVQGGMLNQPHVSIKQLRRQRKDLREELRDVVERDDIGRKQMEKLIKSINAQIEANKENTEQNREVRRALDEHNELYGDVKSSTATAVRGLSNFIGSEVGHRGAQKTRNAGWGVDRRY